MAWSDSCQQLAIEKYLKFHMPILFGSLKSGSSTSQRSYIAIQMTNEGNLIGVPSSLYFAQVCLIIPSRCSSHHYIFPFYAMFTTASNMLSFES